MKNEILEKINIKLKQINKQAYIVGGAVRDYLLNKKINDIDFVTNALISDLKLLFKGDYSFEKGKIGCDNLLAKNITAIFAANDFSAMGALASIKEHNLIVPRDISIVGYDDIAFASLLEVPLTTVRQPIDAIGQKATEVINQLVNSEENIDSKIIILEPKLIVRSSTKAIS